MPDTTSGEGDSSPGLWRTIRRFITGIDGDQSLRAQLEEAIDEHEEDGAPSGNGDLTPLERQMLRNLLHFSEHDADDVVEAVRQAQPRPVAATGVRRDENLAGVRIEPPALRSPSS